MKMKFMRLKYIARMNYGESIPPEKIPAAFVPVFGSNGQFTKTYLSNTLAPAIIIGRKGSYGKVNWSPDECFASDTTFFIDRSTTQENLRWLYYVLQTMKLDEGSNETAVPGLNRETAYNIKIPTPDIKNQEKIADFLDLETAQIDALITAKEHLIALLAEKRQALITKAVTRGLDPKAKMKDSGVEWLGEVPEGWSFSQVRHVTQKIGSGVTPKGGAEIYVKVGIPFLRSQNIHFTGLELDDVVYIPEEVHQMMPNSKVEPGDVLLNITGASIGRCFYYDGQLGEVNVNQHVCIVRPNSKVSTKFLYNFLASKVGQTQIDLNLTGGGREGLNFDRLKAFIIPLPSLKEQNEIVKFIENVTITLDTLCSNTKRSIEVLQERRSSLIAAVVTGKLKI